MTTVSFTPSPRCPDPLVEVLDDRFLKLRIFSGTVEQIVTGLRWGEGPVWFGDGRYLLVSDIPNNRIVRWDEASGAVSDFRNPSNNANGNFRDRQGRLLTCEHLTRRVTRTEYDGSITVLADRFEGKRLNSPNDVVCAQRRQRLVHRSARSASPATGRANPRRRNCHRRSTASRPTASCSR